MFKENDSISIIMVCNVNGNDSLWSKKLKMTTFWFVMLKKMTAFWFAMLHKMTAFWFTMW